MKTITVILLGFSVAFSTMAQDISVTFSSTKAAMTIDSLTATNLMTSQTVTLPGMRTLLLSKTAGITSTAELRNKVSIYPNPFQGSTSIRYVALKSQLINLVINNLIGQVQTQIVSSVQPGNNDFVLTVSSPGIYLVTVSSDQGTTTCKVICSETTVFGNVLEFIGNSPAMKNLDFSYTKKNSQTDYLLGYQEGDKVHYRCWSGPYCTVLTDSAIKSKNYEIDFIPCMDSSGRNYSTVKIGNQIWMEENLAFLPEISPYNKKSYTEPYYYVYAYRGANLSDAKATPYYAKLGVLYNWEAARISCPAGWHLPSIQEWDILTDYLYENYFGYGGRGDRIAKSLASRTDWNTSGVHASVGNNLLYNNSTGFNAVAAGYHISFGSYFMSRNSHSAFWTSDPYSTTEAWQIGLSYDTNIPYKGSMYSLRYDGLSVRCLKD